MEYTEDNKLKLLNDNEDTTPALIHLVITGRASHHYHNGNIIYDKDGHLLVRTKWCFGMDFFKKKWQVQINVKVMHLLKIQAILCYNIIIIFLNLILDHLSYV